MLRVRTLARPWDTRDPALCRVRVEWESVLSDQQPSLLTLRRRAFRLCSLVPLEDSSGNRRRLGHITKQGSSMMRLLLAEAAQVTVRSVPEWRGKYLHLMMRRGSKTAKVAMARKLAVQLYWMMRKGWDYQQWVKFGSHAGQPGHRDGVQSITE